VVFDADAVGVAEKLIHRHAGSPYEGRTWKGVVEATYLRGERVFDGSSVQPQARGQLVLKEGAES
jgi:allantoinase